MSAWRGDGDAVERRTKSVLDVTQTCRSLYGTLVSEAAARACLLSHARRSTALEVAARGRLRERGAGEREGGGEGGKGAEEHGAGGGYVGVWRRRWGAAP